jgi:hypothetical protein
VKIAKKNSCKEGKRVNDAWSEVGCHPGFHRVSEAARMGSEWGCDSIVLHSISMDLITDKVRNGDIVHCLIL